MVILLAEVVVGAQGVVLIFIMMGIEAVVALLTGIEAEVTAPPLLELPLSRPREPLIPKKKVRPIK